MITATIETVEIFRSDSEWEKVLAYSKNVAEKHDVPLESPAHGHGHRAREPPRRYDDGFIYVSTGSRGTSMELDYKVSLYYPILDCSRTKTTLYRQPIIDQYSLNHDYLISETTIAKRVLKDKKLEDISDVVTELVSLSMAVRVVANFTDNFCKHC